MPMALGHEAAGIVEEVGPRASTDLDARRSRGLVFVPSLRPLRPVRRRPAGVVRAGCSRERRRHAAVGRAPAAPRDGTPVNHHLGVSAFAEYATVSRHSLVKVDPELPLDEAALFGCAVLTGVGAVVNTAQVQAGASTAVIGLGGVGLCVAARRGRRRRARRSSRSTCPTTSWPSPGSSARRTTFNARRPRLRRAGPQRRPAAGSSSRSSSQARSARSSWPTRSPAAAAPR